jgi:hypothetical protein
MHGVMNLPESTAQAIGLAIFQTLEVLALISALCVVTASVCLILARRSIGRWAKLLHWLAVLMAAVALGPPLFVLWATSR